MFAGHKGQGIALRILAVILLACGGVLSAQSEPGAPARSGNSETFDVKGGQLQGNDIRRPGPEVLKPGERPHRTQAEVQTLVSQLASAYRSACCPHQKMADRACPCYPMQIGMLTFLASRGFSREEIDLYMVYGGPGGGTKGSNHPDLTAEYSKWLEEVWIPSSAEPLGNRHDLYFRIDFNVRGKMETYGWNHGWSELIRETPHSYGIYLMLLGATILVIGSFVGGAVVLRRMRREPSAGIAGEAESPAMAPAIDDRERERLRKEIRGMDDE